MPGAKKSKMKVKKVKIPIYGGQLIIIKTDDMQAVMNQHGFKVDASKYGAFTFDKYQNDFFRCYVVFNSFSPSLIVHESVHVVNFIYQHVGMKLDIINDEPQAYLTGWVFNEIHKFLEQCQK